MHAQSLFRFKCSQEISVIEASIVVLIIRHFLFYIFSVSWNRLLFEILALLAISALIIALLVFLWSHNPFGLWSAHCPLKLLEIVYALLFCWVLVAFLVVRASIALPVIQGSIAFLIIWASVALLIIWASVAFLVIWDSIVFLAIWLSPFIYLCSQFLVFER